MSTAVAETEVAETSAATRAGGSSFYTAMRILPRAQRDAMFEIYGFCRRVDDIVVFHNLGREALARIVDLQIDRLSKLLAAAEIPVVVRFLASIDTQNPVSKRDVFCETISGTSSSSSRSDIIGRQMRPRP